MHSINQQSMIIPNDTPLSSEITPCPGSHARFAARLSSDIVGVFHYHYLERCRSCGYEIVHDEHFFKIECHLAEDIFSYYEAWNKNSIENGNDLHEIKSTFKKAYEKYPW